jgi:glycosyltransferase involved in cell wall biosynthesis
MADKPKRAWRIVHSESSTGWGGQEHRVLAELSGFQLRGSKVWLLAPRESQIFRRAGERNLALEPLPVSKLQVPLAVLRAARWLHRVKPHIVNTHSSRDGWIVGLGARMARVPFIIRTRHFDVAIPNRWLSRHVYESLADHLITTSPKVTAHFRDFFQWPSDRVSTVPTGIDVELFSPTGPVAELWPADGDRKPPLIGIVSVIRHAKGHSILLEAARLLKESGFAARYVVVGDGPVRSRVEEQIQQLGLGDCAQIAGHREDIPEVLRALDLLLIPSRHEGIPQIALQALATRTPVVASDVGGIPSVIHPLETGRLVPPENPAALAAAIREALAEKDVTLAMAERGRALIVARYSIERMIDTLEELYRRHLPA